MTPHLDPNRPRWIIAVAVTLALIGLFLLIGCPAPRPTVVVKVCEATGLLPNPNCPVVVERRFYTDAAPHDVCTVHQAPGPVYPPQADQTEPRVGVDFYQLIVFPLDQVQQYQDDLVINGGGVLRGFGDFTWPELLDTAGWKSSLFKQVGWWKDVGGQYDGQTFPLFTIASSEEFGSPWNEEVWQKWAAVLKMMADRRVRFTWSVLDGCSMWTPLAKRYNPLLQNYQHQGAEGSGTAAFTKLDGSAGSGLGIHTGGIFGGFGGDNGTMKTYLPALIAKVVATLKASGVDYRVMPGNELQAPVEGSWTSQEHQDGVLEDYLELWIQELGKNGVPADRIVLSIAGTHDRARVTVPLLAKYPGILEQMHGPNSAEAIEKMMTRFPAVEPDGDGFDPFADGYQNSYGYTMPSTGDAPGIRAALKKWGIRQFSIFNGYAEGRGWQDITKAQWAELRAIAGKDLK